jgi:hypothetical protein
VCTCGRRARAHRADRMAMGTSSMQTPSRATPITRDDKALRCGQARPMPQSVLVLNVGMGAHGEEDADEGSLVLVIRL